MVLRKRCEIFLKTRCYNAYILNNISFIYNKKYFLMFPKWVYTVLRKLYLLASLILKINFETRAILLLFSLSVWPSVTYNFLTMIKTWQIQFRCVISRLFTSGQCSLSDVVLLTKIWDKHTDTLCFHVSCTEFIDTQWNPKDLTRSDQAIKQWFKQICFCCQQPKNCWCGSIIQSIWFPPEWLWEIDKHGSETLTPTTASIVLREIGGS